MAKVTFKNQTGNVPELFPINIFDKIPDNHPVRLVDSVVNNLDISDIQICIWVEDVLLIIQE